MMMYIVIGIVIALAILLCLCLAIASFSTDNYLEKFQILDSKRNSYGISTLQFVSAINQKYFRNSLYIASCPEYQDHYSAGTVALSQKTMASNSLASLSIVSHELGHARQDSAGKKLRKHWNSLRIGRIIGLFFLPLLLVGAVLSLLYVFNVLPQLYILVVGFICISIGILIFFFSIFLKYKEIQIEKEASKFAEEYLREILIEPEIKLCVEYLKSARLTYWASLFRTLLGWTFLTKKESMFR